MNAIIVAAGQGSRLWPVTQRMPKTLLPYRDGTILSQILANLRLAGVRRFGIVIGFKGEMIADYLRSQDNLGYDIELIGNPEWMRGNGVSVACARDFLGGAGAALLSMSDHLVHPDGLSALATAPGGRNLLLTDPRVGEIYDLDDATKVRAEAGSILEIGKELTFYNAIDCGVFRIDSIFLDALDEQIAAGRESISDGVRRLVGGPGFGTVGMPSHTAWIDIDTPAAYRYAIEAGDRFFAPALPAAGAADPAEPR